MGGQLILLKIPKFSLSINYDCNREAFSKKIPHWLVVEQCSVNVTYKSVALALTLPSVVNGPSPRRACVPLAPTERILAAPALSLSGSQPLFPIYSALFPPPHHLQSLPAASFPFPSQLRSQLCSHKSPEIEAMRCIFSKDIVPQLWTQRNSIQIIFLLTGKSCLVAALVADMLTMQPFLLTQSSKHSL